MKIRAAVMYEQGHQPPFSVSRPLVIEEVDLDGPGPEEVLVQISAAGLCHSDLSAITGDRPRATPMVPGHEAAGVVIEVGDEVTDLKQGDHVVMVFVSACGDCRFCTSGRTNLCQSSWKARAEGTLRTGARRLHLGGNDLNHNSGISAFAEFAVVSQRSLVRIDRDIPLEIAATFGCAVITGVGAVVNTARMPAGSTAAVVGLGGVGLSALLGVVASGASRIAAIDLSPSKLDLAGELGATDLFDAGAEDCIGRVQETFSGGLDFVFEMAGVVAAARLAYEVTGRGGTMVTSGLPNPSQTLSIPLAGMVADERVIRGSYMGSAIPGRDIPRFMDLYRAGRLPVDRLLSSSIGLAELNEGFDRMAKGESVRDIMLPNGTL